jgi:3-isopropylmalate/(R)-2-methylmalate dehydratase small subunit
MRAFVEHTGAVAALDRANVDTDQIIPKQFLKRIERTGFGQFLFFDYGFRVVVAPTFADIFFNNCFQNGMVPVRLDEADVEHLFHCAREAAARGDRYRLTVDLRSCTIGDDAGFSRAFVVDPFRRHCLLEGLDDIGLSLRHAAEITAWETAHGLPAAAH